MTSDGIGVGRKFWCFFGDHLEVEESILSDWLVAPKGDGRNISVFSGLLKRYKCGCEVYSGNARAWWEGTTADFVKLMRTRGIKDIDGTTEYKSPS